MDLLRTFVAVGASAVLLSACGGMQLQKAEKTAAPGSAFEQGLHSGYLKLAKGESGEGDYRDSDTFARRVIATSKGEMVGPEDIAARKLPGDKVSMLSTSRARLISALDKGGAEKAPAAASHAQVMFDCWMQEQEENFQPNDIEACRGEFYAALKQVEDAVRPVEVAAPAPAPEPMKAQTFVVYFDTDKAELDDSAKAVLAEAEAAASKMQGANVLVSGNADRAGSNGYNLKLSEMRANAVATALAGGNIASKSIKTSAFGEEKPAFDTADGISARENRRVEITIEP